MAVVIVMIFAVEVLEELEEALQLLLLRFGVAVRFKHLCDFLQGTMMVRIHQTHKSMPMGCSVSLELRGESQTVCKATVTSHRLGVATEAILTRMGDRPFR